MELDVLIVIYMFMSLRKFMNEERYGGLFHNAPFLIWLLILQLISIFAYWYVYSAKNYNLRIDT
jgi:hypothetical protein